MCLSVLSFLLFFWRLFYNQKNKIKQHFHLVPENGYRYGGLRIVNQGPKKLKLDFPSFFKLCNCSQTWGQSHKACHCHVQMTPPNAHFFYIASNGYVYRGLVSSHCCGSLLWMTLPAMTAYFEQCCQFIIAK